MSSAIKNWKKFVGAIKLKNKHDGDGSSSDSSSSNNSDDHQQLHEPLPVNTNTTTDHLGNIVIKVMDMNKQITPCKTPIRIAVHIPGVKLVVLIGEDENHQLHAVGMLKG